MQLNENSNVPYPCLNVNISDEEMSPFIDFDIPQRNLAQTTLHIKTKVNNVAIQRLIEDGVAQYCCELDCRRSFNRKAYLNNTGEFKITLMNNNYNGKIVGVMSVVAIKDITNYKNTAFDDFFNRFSIDIAPGEPLAYLGTIEIEMEEKSMQVKSIADDFIEVVKDETLKYSRFDLAGEKITLKLPEALYDRYQNPRISESRECESFLHASFLLNVLTTALHQIGEHKESKWAETLRTRIETEDMLREIIGDDEAFDEDGNLASPECALDLAQAILANPYERMFDSLENDNEDMYDE